MDVPSTSYHPHANDVMAPTRPEQTPKSIGYAASQPRPSSSSRLIERTILHLKYRPEDCQPRKEAGVGTGRKKEAKGGV